MNLRQTFERMELDLLLRHASYLEAIQKVERNANAEKQMLYDEFRADVESLLRTASDDNATGAGNGDACGARPGDYGDRGRDRGNVGVVDIERVRRLR